MNRFKKEAGAALCTAAAVCLLAVPACADTDDPAIVPSDSETVFTDRRSVVLPGCEKDGYSFIGWNTSEDGSGVFYLPGYTLSLSDGDSISLYGIWNRLPEDETALPETETDGGEEPEEPTPDEELYEENVAEKNTDEMCAVPELPDDSGPGEEQQAPKRFSVCTDSLNHVFLTDAAGTHLPGGSNTAVQTAETEITGGFILYLHPEEGYELPGCFGIRFLGRSGSGELEPVSRIYDVFTHGEPEPETSQAMESTEMLPGTGLLTSHLAVTVISASEEEPFLWDGPGGRLEILVEMAPEFEAVEIIAEGVPVISFELRPDEPAIPEDTELLWEDPEQDFIAFDFQPVLIQDCGTECGEQAW